MHHRPSRLKFRTALVAGTLGAASIALWVPAAPQAWAQTPGMPAAPAGAAQAAAGAPVFPVSVAELPPQVSDTTTQPGVAPVAAALLPVAPASAAQPSSVVAAAQPSSNGSVAVAQPATDSSAGAAPAPSDATTVAAQPDGSDSSSAAQTSDQRGPGGPPPNRPGPMTAQGPARGPLPPRGPASAQGPARGPGGTYAGPPPRGRGYARRGRGYARTQALARIPAQAPRLPNAGTGGLLDTTAPVTASSWAALALALAAMVIGGSGVLAYARKR